MQGLCAGGEISAVSTYIAEVAAARSMGRCVALIAISGNMGFLLARVAIWSSQWVFNEDEMLHWGWRWPFLLAFFPGVISASGRAFCLKESEVFEAEHSLLEESDSDDSDEEFVVNRHHRRAAKRGNPPGNI